MTEEVKKGVETIKQLSEVHIYRYYCGADPDRYLEKGNDDNNDLIDLKNQADDFYKEAGHHKWKRL